MMLCKVWIISAVVEVPKKRSLLLVFKGPIKIKLYKIKCYYVNVLSCPEGIIISGIHSSRIRHYFQLSFCHHKLTFFLTFQIDVFDVSNRRLFDVSNRHFYKIILTFIIDILEALLILVFKSMVLNVLFDVSWSPSCRRNQSTLLLTFSAFHIDFSYRVLFGTSHWRYLNFLFDVPLIGHFKVYRRH